MQKSEYSTMMMVDVSRRRRSVPVLWHQLPLSVSLPATFMLWTWQTLSSRESCVWYDCIEMLSDTFCELPLHHSMCIFVVVGPNIFYYTMW